MPFFENESRISMIIKGSGMESECNKLLKNAMCFDPFLSKTTYCHSLNQKIISQKLNKTTILVYQLFLICYYLFR